MFTLNCIIIIKCIVSLIYLLGYFWILQKQDIHKHLFSINLDNNLCTKSSWYVHKCFVLFWILLLSWVHTLNWPSKAIQLSMNHNFTSDIFVPFFSYRQLHNFSVMYKEKHERVSIKILFFFFKRLLFLLLLLMYENKMKYTQMTLNAYKCSWEMV